MTGFTKLFASLIHSTVWREAMHVKVVWITMLAMAEQNGEVMASLPGLADAARVSLDECIDALEKLSSPDPYSRTKDNEGRRVMAIDGGWFLFTYEKHRKAQDAETRKEQVRAAVARHRANKRNQNGNQGNQSNPLLSQEEAERERDGEVEVEVPQKKRANGAPTYDQLFEEAWAAYPKCANNSKAEAWRQWLARVAQGVEPLTMLEGTRRYGRFIEATGQYVKHAATFFGRDRHFENDFTVPPIPPPRSPNGASTRNDAAIDAWLADEQSKAGRTGYNSPLKAFSDGEL